MVTWATFDARGFAFTRGRPQSFKSSPSVARGFCAACGTCLTYQRESLPEEIDVTACSFDDPGRFPPQDHTWFSERLSWVCAEDGLVRFERSRSAG